jgi:hypothetical protein
MIGELRLSDLNAEIMGLRLRSECPYNAAEPGRLVAERIFRKPTVIVPIVLGSP